MASNSSTSISAASNPVDIAWLQAALTEKPTWQAKAQEILDGLQAEEFTTMADITRLTKASILVDGKQLPDAIIQLLKDKATAQAVLPVPSGPSSAPGAVQPIGALVSLIESSLTDALCDRTWEQVAGYHSREMLEVLQNHITTMRTRPCGMHNKVILVEGIRRCGKTILLRKVAASYESGVLYFKVLGVVRTASELLELIDLACTKFGVKYLFLDEIEHIPGFSSVLHNRLEVFNEVVFVVSGSQSILDNMFAPTHLANRYVLVHLTPFSCLEYLKAKGLTEDPEHVRQYLKVGGFPGVVLARTSEDAQNEASEIYHDILSLGSSLGVDPEFKARVFNIAKNLMQQIGSIHFKTTTDSLALNYLTSVFLFYTLTTEVKSSNLSRVFCVDPSLLRFDISLAHNPIAVVESVVFLEFKRMVQLRRLKSLRVYYPYPQLKFHKSSVDYAANNTHYASLICMSKICTVVTVKRKVEGMLTTLLESKPSICTLIFVDEHRRFAAFGTSLFDFLLRKYVNIADLLGVVIYWGFVTYPNLLNMVTRQKSCILGRLATFVVFFVVGGGIRHLKQFVDEQARHCIVQLPAELFRQIELYVFYNICDIVFPTFENSPEW